MADIEPGVTPRAREWAAGIPAFEARVAAWWARWRPYALWIAGGGALTYAVLHQLFMWAAVVAALFALGWIQNDLRVQRWARHVLTNLRLRLTPSGQIYIQWPTPPADYDHEVARTEFARVMTQLHALPRDVEGDGRIERRKWLYAATEQADGLIIRGDDPFLAIRTRPQSAASAPVQGFVGAAATGGVLRHWRAIVMAVLSVAAALFYARGEVLETQRDTARTDKARAEERAATSERFRLQAEQDLAEWVDVDRTETRLALEQARISRTFLQEQEARRRRLEARRAEREREIVADTPVPVDLSDSLRDLAAPAAALPEMPGPAAGSDPAG